MSTLLDALKKAEKTQQTQAFPQTPVVQQAKTSAKPKGDIPAIVVVLLALVFVVVVIRAVSIKRRRLQPRKRRAARLR